jgi:soluble lytic murein transglycosylase-like protein
MTPATLSLWLLLSSPLPPQHYIPGNPWSYQQTVEWYADANLVPRWLARKTAEVESGYVPTARSKEWKQDRHGVWRPGKVLARGLFQISVQYQSVHVRAAGMTRFDWRNPSDSSRVGLRLLRWLLDRYGGDKMLAVASYNCGYPRLESALPLPLETVKHLRKVFG